LTVSPLFPATYKKPFALAARALFRLGVQAATAPYGLRGRSDGSSAQVEALAEDK
jgi:hypothetical protein